MALRREELSLEEQELIKVFREAKAREAQEQRRKARRKDGRREAFMYVLAENEEPLWAKEILDRVHELFPKLIYLTEEDANANLLNMWYTIRFIGVTTESGRARKVWRVAPLQNGTWGIYSLDNVYTQAWNFPVPSLQEVNAVIDARHPDGLDEEEDDDYDDDEEDY